MGGFGQIMKNMLGGVGHYANELISQTGPGMPNWQRQQQVKQGQERVDIEKQQEQRQQEDADQAFSEMVNRGVVKPSFHGMVAEDHQIPDVPGIVGGGEPVRIYRQADKTRVIRHKDASGQTIEGELATPEEQMSLNQKRLSQKLLGDYQAQNSPEMIDAQRTTAVEGARTATMADQTRRQLGGVSLSDMFTPEARGRMGIPDNSPVRLMPNEAIQEVGKMIAPSIGAQSRENIADKNNTSRQGIASANRTDRDQLAADKLAFEKQKNDRDLTMKDAISRRTAAIQSGDNPNLAPIKLRQFTDGVSKLQSMHSELDDRQQKIFQAQDLLDPETTPDGTKFKDPFTGAPKVMNQDVRDGLTQVAAGQKKINEILGGVASRQMGQLGIDAPAAKPATGGGAGVPSAHAGASPATGDDYLKTLRPDEANVVRGMATGAIPAPSGTSRSAIAQRRLKQLMTYDPEFSTQRAQVRKAFTTGPDGKNIGSLNTAVVHLDQFADAADALKNDNFRPGNAAFNALSSAFGSSAPTNFDALKAVVSGEMANALKGNATDQEIHSISSTIMSSSSPDQLKGFIETQLHTLGAKLNTYQERYSQQIPNDKAWSPVLPSAGKVFAKHGVNPTGRDAGGNGGGQSSVVKVISPEGAAGTIPAEKLQEALKRGFKQVQ